MKKIPFVKYSCYGNNFVIIDETITPVLSEMEKSSFAYRATNTCFGIGSDNLLIIQSCREKTLESINNIRNYWNKVPNYTEADFIFRMFEPSGEEALCCGNGLMCIADYLYRQYGLDSVRIMTEIPFSKPNIISIGTEPHNASSWANMGNPRRIPSELVDSSAVEAYSNNIDLIKNISIKFRTHDLQPFTKKTELTLCGYLVFTGEPHLVIFVENDLSILGLDKVIFKSSILKFSQSVRHEKRGNFGSWLVNHIGFYINTHYLNIFPMGLSINFVRIDNDLEKIEYRCFERGINRETLACGTGCLANSYVARHLKLITRREISVVPYRYSWHEPQAKIRVLETENGWVLNGKPFMLFSGKFLDGSSREKRKKNLDCRISEYS